MNKFFKNHITRCEAGVSLVQVIMASTAIAGLALIGLKMSKDQALLALSTQQTYEAHYIVEEIKKILEDPKNCRENFSGRSPKSSFGILDSIVETKTLTEGLSVTQRYQTFESSGFLYGQNDLRIAKYSLSDKRDVVNADDGRTELVIEFDKGEESIGARFLKRFITLQFNPDDDGNIKDCVVKGSAFSSPAWTIEGKNIILNKERLGIGTTVPRAKLHVKGSVGLLSDELKPLSCNDINRGSVLFNKGKRELVVCDGLKWKKVGLKKINWGLPSTFRTSVKEAGSKTENIGSHRLCILSRFLKNDSSSGCNIKKDLIGGRGEWLLEAYTSAKVARMECEALCFN